MAAISSVGAYVPAQRVQAERAAAQAEGRAQRLAAESQQARSQADRLNQRADRLREASGQAQNEANNARRSGEASPAVFQVGQPATAAVPRFSSWVVPMSTLARAASASATKRRLARSPPSR